MCYASYIKTLNDFTRVKSVEFPMTNSGFLAQLFLIFLRVQKAGFLLADWRQRDASLGTHSILTHVFIYWTTFCCLDDVSERKNTRI